MDITAHGWVRRCGIGLIFALYSPMLEPWPTLVPAAFRSPIHRE
jgi:hypothetical protein